MSEKSKVLQLLDLIDPGWTPPAPLEDGDLLEQGLLFVLSRTLTEAQAHQTVRALRAAYPDSNELRISQIQEFREHVKTKSDDTARAAATDVRTYLQEVFQKNHGFDLEFLRQDSAAAGKMISELEFLGGAAGHLVLSIASNGELPVTQGVVRVLDRVGVVARVGSVKKAKESLAPLIPADRVRDFALRIGHVAETFCDPKKPICWECPLVVTCKHGKKVQKDWLAQQKRLEIQRKKEEKRLEALRKKEEAREKREAERARKKAEAAARKAERELARRQREQERKRKHDQQAREKREREDARKRAAAEKKAAEKKKAEAERKRKAAAKPKKSATKKAATKKKVAAKKSVTKKKASGRSTTRKKATAKRATTRKGSTTRKKPTTAKRTPQAKARKTSKKNGSAGRGTSRKTSARRR